jgi:G3E family GTPase
MTESVKLILVGGFLGAGKTTLVAQAAQRLAARGQRVRLITNDQAANLVDTAVLKDTGSSVDEVSGGCFCCRFNDLVGVMERMVAESRPDVLIGEPVGSCTDLSATVLQPIKEKHRDRFRVAPFSVLVDVKQVRTLDRLRRSLRESSGPRFPESVMYIYQKQLEEADLIVLNKADLLPPGELAELEGSLRREFPRVPLMTMSALEGDGVDAWLDFLSQDRPAGSTIPEVDYDQYAEGEASLGWLNAAIRLFADGPADWRTFCADLMDAVQDAIRGMPAEVAHLKLHLTAGEGSLVANLTGNDGQPSIRGDVEPTSSATLLVNVRAQADPERLADAVRECLEKVSQGKARLVIDELQSFSPARPQPTHRYRSVV